MAAIPARRPAALPAHSQVTAGCRAYASTAVLCADDARHLLQSLRRAERCLNAWRAMALERAAATGQPAPAPVSLGAFTRHFARWLETRPQRADDPAEWLMQEALRTLNPPPQKPGTP